MLNRILNLFLDSFKYLYREKLSFFISSSTIALCIFIISIISLIGYYSVSKIISLNNQEIFITFNDLIDKNCNTQCLEELNKSKIKICPECPVFDPSFLEIKPYDDNFDIYGKQKCKDCCEDEGFLNGKRILSSKCDEACSPDIQSEYPLYYGSKQDNECKECLDRGCDQVNNQIIIIEGIEEKKESIYKHDILRIWEDIMDENYFLGPYRGPMIDLPMGGNFIISDKINSIKELNKVLNSIKKNEYVENVETDFDDFIYYRKLIPVILGIVLAIILFSLIIPFFIISNTIRLIIHSKRDVLHTLRILGEKDIFIKLPFILQGIWQGIIGGSVVFLSLYFFDILGVNILISQFLNTTITSSKEVVLNLVDIPILLILFLGFLLGFVGAIRSVSKYLK